ncbi:uncharacterized protein RSE6_13469 [Rhynchosporium secalis]|uniref:Uncharacterized protein n=1 Tax=Rhynchosporium secalis TaxID=38038 RepID=A0A1E1MSZ0_RHYSE|nr:uncharacterized protein RSE6_13469 [Rhynchosporium secalis]
MLDEFTIVVVTSTLEQTSSFSRGIKLPSRTKLPGDVASSSGSRVWQESQIPGINHTPEPRKNFPDVESVSEAGDDDEEIASVRRVNRERRSPTRWEPPNESTITRSRSRHQANRT